MSSLITRIHRAMAHAIANNAAKVDLELFLGPSERKELQDYCNQHLAVGVLDLINHDGKAKYCGLTIRFLQNDGVRVGVTWSEAP